MRESWKNRIVGTGEEPPDQLLANPNNWRVHTKRQRQALEAVLDEVGWVDDIIVNRTTGHVVDGHLRIEMAMAAGVEKVPVKYVELSEEEERLLLTLFDPIAAMAEADKEKLAELISELPRDNDRLLDLVADVAKANKVSLDLIEKPEAPEAQIDKAEELREKWGTREGQIWKARSAKSVDVTHLIICGDSYANESRTYFERAGLIFTDVPYDSHDFSWMSNVSKDDGWLFIMLEDDQVQTLCDVLRGSQRLDRFFVGHTGFTMPRGNDAYVSHILVARVKIGKGGAVNNVRDGFSTVIRMWYRGALQDERWISHQKNVQFVEPFLLRYSNARDVILDPFCGSGTTLISCERTERTGIGIEINPAHVAVALERLAEMGLEPELVEG